MTGISLYLSKVTIEGKVIYQNLTMFPLCAEEEDGLGYLTLDEALGKGVVHIGEMSRAGSVPELQFENAGKLPVLVVDGEEFVGAKQNRVANLTVLVPAHTTIVLPVSCVEAGRWRHDSPRFVASERAHFATGRASRVASVSYAMESAGSRRSDQARVWRDIAEVACRMDAPSPTQAMAAVFDRHRSRIQDYVAGLSATDDQVGAVFAIGSEVIGLDLFDRSSTLTALLPKLVRSYAVDALDVTGEGRSAPGVGAATAFLESVASAKLNAYPAVGLGTDIRLSAARLTGGGLVVDDRLIHLAAFAVADESADARPGDRGMASARQRRRSVQRR